MRLSMVLIARDEQDNVRQCFDTFWEHVDEVVLCDTGSEDGTLAEARRYATEEGKLIVCRFKWCDDFAAARNFAHAHATGEVQIFMDLDERLEGGHRLRALSQTFEAEPGLSAFMAMINMGPGGLDARHRVFRGAPRWKGPVHEVPILDGATWFTDAVTWRKGRVVARPEYLRRALDWAEAEPSSFDALVTVARCAHENGDFELVDDFCARTLQLDLSPRDRSWILLRRALGQEESGDVEAAAKFARLAIRVGTPVLDTWPYGLMRANFAVADSWVLLARVQVALGRHQAALVCAERANAIRSVPMYEQENRRWFAAWLDWQRTGSGNVSGAGSSGTRRTRRSFKRRRRA